ncbi:MAG: carbohydrate binding domain-containing protein [Sedimentisphaerales bacterium]
MALCLFSINASAGENVLTNPGFETGDTSGWTTWSGNFAASNAQAHTGAYSGLCTDRTEYWQGPVQSVLGKMINGQTYHCSAWVRIENAASADVSMNIAQTDGSGTNYHVINRKTAYDNQWIQLSGDFTLNVTGSLTQLDFYFNWPDAGVNFYVDDASVEGNSPPQDWKQQANARIEQLRKTNAKIIVLNQANQPVPGVNVEINQIKKSFPFGCVMGQSLFKEPKFKTYYADVFKFNWAVFQNEAKWYSTEPYAWGYITYRQMNAMLDFCEQKGINARGHLIFWPVEDYVQQWVKNLDNQDLWLAMQQRLNGVVIEGLGRFKMWDVCSEMVTGTYFEDRLGQWVNTWMFQTTKLIDPEIINLIDEYCVISCGGAHLQAYKDKIRNLLLSGAPIDVIGVECYNMTEFDPDTIMARFDSMSEFGLPIWITQLQINEPNVNTRADKLETVIRTAYSHPAVYGIMQWTFYEENEGTPQCSLIDKGWHINAMGQRYLDLMTEWETHDSDTTDAGGAVNFRGFQGTYEITLTYPGGNCEVQTIELPDIPGTIQFTLKVGTGTPIDNEPPQTQSFIWLSPPQAVSCDVVSMTAPDAVDTSGVLYYFNNVTDPNHDSGWQESSFYADSGLTPNTNYTYRFKIRDKSTQKNETPYSNTASALTPGSGGNIIANGGFEAASEIGWTTWGCDLTSVQNPSHSGNYCGLTQIRAQTWQGPVQNITDKVVNGKTYKCSAWVLTDSAAGQPVSINLQQTDGGGTKYLLIANGLAQNGQWTYLSGQFVLNVTGTLQSLNLYISGPAPGVGLYVDDVIVKTDPADCCDVRLFGYKLPSDLNGDCYVDYSDLAIIALYWLHTDCADLGNCEHSDFEPDGDVDFADFSDFGPQWSQCNDPQNPRCTPNWW